MGGVIVHATIVNAIDYSASMFRVIDHATGVDYRTSCSDDHAIEDEQRRDYVLHCNG